MLYNISGCSNGADVVFALDSSGTVGTSNFNLMKSFVGDLAAGVDLDGGAVRLGLVTFADSVVERFDLSRYRSREDARAAIAGVPYAAGATTLASDALRYIRTVLFTPSKGDRPGVPNILVVLTDGGGSDDKRRALDEAEYAKMSGIHVVTIGVGDLVDVYTMNAMSSYPNTSNALKVDRFGDLSQLLGRIRNMICDSK